MASVNRQAPSRTVARPVANLGNTCFMNAVLQALSHAPELCLAMDVESHSAHCPVKAENDAKRRASPSIETDSIKGMRKSRRAKSPSSDESTDGLEFCALCEVENHIKHVHDSSKRDKPFAPNFFVNGFIQHVAPHFKLGMQEDSHEFLRLLIDAMQKSCHKARSSGSLDDETDQQEEDENDATKSDQDKEYPFSLFRGMVESSVICNHCRACSKTIDPIEDIGLEVTVPQTDDAPSGTRASSRGASPLPFPLTDVQTAFQRFAKAEDLDSGYKCEKCGKVGRASKQSRLASIPPILTLHLKRFRYGDSRGVRQSGRNNRSEVNQLLQYPEFLGGKSGSAKIEGHIKFDPVFDLRPYLTDELQSKTRGGMLCRLFAVIVHAGKNSHSGHYVAYVRNIERNEWWKMDDGRVTEVGMNEVLQAEAYMLFYRVVQHPVAEQLHANLKRQLQEQEAAAETEAAMEESSTPSRKRSATTAFENGEAWARSRTKLPRDLLKIVGYSQEFLSDKIELTAECNKRIENEASSENAMVGKGPARKVSGTLLRWLCQLGSFR